MDNHDKCTVCWDPFHDCTTADVFGCHCTLLLHGACLVDLVRRHKIDKCPACGNRLQVVVQKRVHFTHVGILIGLLMVIVAYLYLFWILADALSAVHVHVTGKAWSIHGPCTGAGAGCCLRSLISWSGMLAGVLLTREYLPHWIKNEPRLLIAFQLSLSFNYVTYLAVTVSGFALAWTAYLKVRHDPLLSALGGVFAVLLLGVCYGAALVISDSCPHPIWEVLTPVLALSRGGHNYTPWYERSRSSHESLHLRSEG